MGFRESSCRSCNALYAELLPALLRGNGQSRCRRSGGNVDRILKAVEEAGVKVEKILVTHGHLDHVGAVAELSERLEVPVEGPQEEDRFWIASLEEQGRIFGFGNARSFEPDRWLEDGDTVFVGKRVLRVLHCPGHTPGHVVFFDEEARLAIVGDVIFQGSIGRTDFPGGSHDVLVRSIREKLFPLGDDVEFLPGHGSSSTFGEERRDNPFVGGRYR